MKRSEWKRRKVEARRKRSSLDSRRITSIESTSSPATVFFGNSASPPRDVRSLDFPHTFSIFLVEAFQDLIDSTCQRRWIVVDSVDVTFHQVRLTRPTPLTSSGSTYDTSKEKNFLADILVELERLERLYYDLWLLLNCIIFCAVLLS